MTREQDIRDHTLRRMGGWFVVWQGFVPGRVCISAAVAGSGEGVHAFPDINPPGGVAREGGGGMEGGRGAAGGVNMGSAGRMALSRGGENLIVTFATVDRIPG